MATVLSVVLPTSSGILTGTTLAVARAAGETAPLLFDLCDCRNLADPGTQPTRCCRCRSDLEYSESPDANLNAQAWATAFVLIAFVLVASLTARLLYDRSRRKLGQGR